MWLTYLYQPPERITLYCILFDKKKKKKMARPSLETLSKGQIHNPPPLYLSCQRLDKDYA